MQLSVLLCYKFVFLFMEFWNGWQFVLSFFIWKGIVLSKVKPVFSTLYSWKLNNCDLVLKVDLTVCKPTACILLSLYSSTLRSCVLDLSNLIGVLFISWKVTVIWIQMLPKLLTIGKEDTANYNIIHHFLLNYNVIDMHISDLKLIYGVN